MSKFDIIISVILGLACVGFLIFDISMFISWSKAKEKAFVSNWTSFLMSLLLGVGVVLPNKDSIFSIIYIICLILMLPLEVTCLSPEGIRSSIFKNNGIDPVENYSYEFGKNSLGMETLYIFDSRKTRGIPYNIGIKKTKTVKMLADWYGKHGYENPLTK